MRLMIRFGGDNDDGVGDEIDSDCSLPLRRVHGI
jgi:hypothetical protein